MKPWRTWLARLGIIRGVGDRRRVRGGRRAGPGFGWPGGGPAGVPRRPPSRRSRARRGRRGRRRRRPAEDAKAEETPPRPSPPPPAPEPAAAGGSASAPDREFGDRRDAGHGDQGSSRRPRAGRRRCRRPATPPAGGPRPGGAADLARRRHGPVMAAGSRAWAARAVRRRTPAAPGGMNRSRCRPDAEPDAGPACRSQMQGSRRPGAWAGRHGRAWRGPGGIAGTSRPISARPEGAVQAFLDALKAKDLAA